MVDESVRVLTYVEAITEALREEMERDERVVLLGPTPRGAPSVAPSVLRDLLVEAGDERVLELPVTELGCTGAAVGAAMAGLRPVVEWQSADLAALAMDAVVNQAARARFLSGGEVAVPVVFRVPIGGYGSVGAQSSQSPVGWFSAVPGLKVALPATPRDAYGLLKSAIRDEDPVLFLEHRQLYEMRGEIPAGEGLIPIGAAEVKRPGTDVSIVTFAYMVEKSLAAAELLAEEGIEVEVLDLRSTLPLDEEAILATVARTGRLIIVQEAYGPCSVASEVAAVVAEQGLYHLDAPIRRVTARWAPIPFAPELGREVLPQTEQIVAAVSAVLEESH